MSWQEVLFLILGLLAGIGLGILIGRYLMPAPDNTGARAIEKEDAADAKADAARQKIDDDLAQKVEETREADAKELTDALNKDFSDPPPGV